VGSELFLFMKETSKIPFSSYREQDRTTVHSGGMNGKL